MPVLVPGSAADSHLLVQALLVWRNQFPQGVLQLRALGVCSCCKEPNTVYNTQQWKGVVEAWPGTGKPTAPGGGGRRRGRQRSFLPFWPDETPAASHPIITEN